MSRTEIKLNCLVGVSTGDAMSTTMKKNWQRKRGGQDVMEKILLHVALGVVFLLATSCGCHASLPLDCKAMGSLEDPGNTSMVVVQPEQQQQQQEGDEYYYAIGTVDPNNAQGAMATAETMMPSTDVTSLLKTQPPSMAPSMAQPCSDPLSNARGQYTSTMAPCVVKFHNANIQRQEQEDDKSQQSGQQQEQQVQQEIDFIDYRTSNLCHDDNVIIEIKEYVQAWPDECVGDFERCYSLEHHFSLLCDFLCEKEQHQSFGDYAVGLFSPYQQQQEEQQYRPHWELPEGTTHISVTCTLDKGLVMEENDKEARMEREEIREAQRHDMQSRLFNGLVVFVSALTIIYALSQLIVTPLVTVATAVVAASRRGGRGAAGDGYDTDIDDDDDAIDGGSHLSVRRSSSSRNRRRTSFLDRRSSSISSLPVHQQEVAALVVSADELTLDGDEQDLQYEGELRASGSDTVSSLHDTSGSFHHPHAFEDEGEHYASSAAAQDQESNDFDSQIPLDFDAVPIVPAIILQDGITYS